MQTETEQRIKGRQAIVGLSAVCLLLGHHTLDAQSRLNTQPPDEAIIQPRAAPWYPKGAGWALRRFACRDSVVRGYVVVDDSMRQELATIDGVTREFANATWQQLTVNTTGWRALWERGHTLRQLPKPLWYDVAIDEDRLRKLMNMACVQAVLQDVVVVLDQDGQVLEASMEGTTGHDGVDKAVLAVVKTAKYDTASRDSRPVPFKTVLRFGYAGGYDGGDYSTGVIHGRMLDGFGGVVANATVELTPSGDRTQTTEKGTFEFSKLRPGDYVVRPAGVDAGRSGTLVKVTHCDTSTVSIYFSNAGSQ